MMKFGQRLAIIINLPQQIIQGINLQQYWPNTTITISWHFDREQTYFLRCQQQFMVIV